MQYLDFDRLEALDPEAFLNAEPYPYVNPEGALTEAGFHELRATLPEVERFDSYFGVRRLHGQQPHDRFVMEYHDDLVLSEPWRGFIEELRSDRYMRFLKRMLGRGRIWLSFHWHYTPAGCSVSPHCDALRKLGSHIFYFNTAEDWRPEWGGETLVLDDHGRFSRRSAPRFEDFDEIISADALGNRSFLFARKHNSWHGVREIRCPEGAYRKVFIVVINDWVMTLPRRTREWLTGNAEAGY